MALAENGMTPADIAAVVNENGGAGFGGNGAWWLLVLFLFAMNGGNFGWGGRGGGGNPNAVQDIQSDMQRGFDQQNLMNGINALNNTVQSGFANAEISRGNAQMNLLQTLNGNAMAMQQGFCDNRAGLADLKFTVAQENCLDRQTINDGLRDLMAQNTANTQAIIQSQTQGFQGIQDKLCQMEIDALKERNASLQNQLNMANLAASQTAQTAQLMQDNTAQTVALIQRIAPIAIPAYTVPNPNTSTATTATA